MLLDIEDKTDVVTITHVRWRIPSDVIDILTAHQSALTLQRQKFVTREEAAIDLIRKRGFPKVIVFDHQE